jgi:cobalamin synthase
MNVLGHFLLFSPIIKLMAWIPLVGWLLSSILSFAAFLFALVWGTCLHFLILSIAWIVYRPIYGILMLSISVVMIGLIQYSG